MNTYIDNLNGKIDFRVEAQPALPKWQRIAITDALNRTDSPPKSLRFQCRIATDARTVFEEITLPDGETLTLHDKARPQFGKDSSGHAFLTVTLKYSGDGKGYRFRWVGEAVPRKMQEVAVKHDEGRAVRAVTIPLDLEAATVVPAWKAQGRASAQRRDADRKAKERGYRSAYEEKRKAARATSAGYTFGRLTAADLPA